VKNLVERAFEKKVTRFIKHVGRGINRFNMIGDKDRILIGASGGKDSLCLALSLSQRKKWVPISYDLHALLIDWKEYPLSAEEKDKLLAFFKTLDIPLSIVSAQMIHEVPKKGFNCYICSRNRKRILFSEAEKLGISKIALGHSLDDIIETTLMNLFFRGEFSTMMPVQEFFKGKMKIIRPMCEVYEKEIIKITKILDLPVVSVDCPNKETNQRIHMKSIISGLIRINKDVRDNIYRAPWNINTDYLPRLKKE
jgi:tRNA 2-thiocytidine biosynthesis protein TtcA